MTLDDFIKDKLGKKVDWDKKYGGQCVDLYRYYLDEVLGYPQSPLVVGASEIWDTVDINYFEKISNTPDGVPEKGDIVIWNKKVGKGFGHIGIFLEGTVKRFVSLDQNWLNIQVVKKVAHNYLYVIGWLRPKKTMQTNNIEISKKLYEKLVTKSANWDGVADFFNLKKDDADKHIEIINKFQEYLRGLEEVGKQLNEKKDVISRLSQDLLIVKDERNGLMEQVEKLRKELENKEELRQKWFELAQQHKQNWETCKKDLVLKSKLLTECENKNGSYKVPSTLKEKLVKIIEIIFG